MSESSEQVNRQNFASIGSQDSYYSHGEEYELQSFYCREVNQHALLTGAEESRWAEIFFISRGRIQKMLLAYPSLLLQKALAIMEQQSAVLGNFIEIAEEGADISEIRAFLQKWQQNLDSHEEFDFRFEVVHLGIVKIRDLFYEDCLDLIFREHWIPRPEESTGWEENKALLGKYRLRMVESRNHLFNGNLRLVLSIARKYSSSNSMSLADLVQEGNIGLLRAIESFEYRRGHRFSTYATYWIRQAISKALCNHGRTIRMPVHIIRELSKIRRCERELLQATGETPAVEDIARLLKMSVSRIRGLLKMSQQPISLENIGHDDQSWEDVLMDGNDESFRNQMEQSGHQLKDVIQQALDCLDLRERQIIERHFGLNNCDSETHEQIGRSFHLSSERIRQIEMGALRKLKLHGVF